MNETNKDSENIAMKVGSIELEALLQRLGLEFTINHSNNWSDRYGPSLSVYYKTPFATIRLSDHNSWLPEGSNRIELFYGDPLSVAELRIRTLAKLDVSQELLDRVQSDREAKASEDRAEWLASDEYEKQVAFEAKKEAREKRIREDLIQLGHGDTLGRQKRQLINLLHSYRNRNELFKQYGIVPARPFV